MALAEAGKQYATGIWFRLTQGGVLQHVQPGPLVELLRKTRLPEPTLASLWEVANPASNPVDKDGFARILRLVSCFQNNLDWRTVPVYEAVPLPRIDGFPPEDILPSSLLTQLSIQGVASDVGVRVAAKPMLSGQATVAGTSLGADSGTEEMDFQLSPSEKFEAESTFAQYSKGSALVRVGGLEEVFIKSGISRGDWIKLCDLVDRQASGYINQTQLAYLLRMINQRRKGRRLPIMLPSDVVRAMTSGLPLSDIVEPALKPPGPSRSFGLESKDLLSLDDTPTRPSKPPSPAPARPRSPVGQSDSSQSDYRLLLRYVQAEKDTLESHVVALDRELKGIQGQIGVYRDEVLPAADQSLRLLESLGIKV